MERRSRAEGEAANKEVRRFIQRLLSIKKGTSTMEIHRITGRQQMKNGKKWVKAAALRAVRTVAQTAVATIGTSAVMGAVNWTAVASASVLAGILSLLTSVAGLPEVKEE